MLFAWMRRYFASSLMMIEEGTLRVAARPFSLSPPLLWHIWKMFRFFFLSKCENYFVSNGTFRHDVTSLPISTKEDTNYPNCKLSLIFFRIMQANIRLILLASCYNPNHDGVASWVKTFECLTTSVEWSTPYNFDATHVNNKGDSPMPSFTKPRHAIIEK